MLDILPRLGSAESDNVEKAKIRITPQNVKAGLRRNDRSSACLKVYMTYADDHRPPEKMVSRVRDLVYKAF
jgi:hypothetical protein